jgi:hypothetical protein
MTRGQWTLIGDFTGLGALAGTEFSDEPWVNNACGGETCSRR